jgi:type I restriction enzyme S subunit
MTMREKVFFKNISAYITIVNNELEKTIPIEPISKHIKIIGGYSFKSGEYRSTGIPIIRISDFQDEKIDLSSVRYYKESKEFERFELSEGDIIIAMTGGTIGKLAIVQSGLGKLYLNQRVGKFSILNPIEFIPEYIYWIARGIQDKVKNMGYGGAQPNIGNAQIEAMQLPFPGKNIQAKIVSFFNDLKNGTLKKQTYFNDKVEEQILKLQELGESISNTSAQFHQQTDIINKLRQAILQDAVQGKLVPQNPKDEPASELLKRIKAEKEKLTAQGKLKKEKPLPPITNDEIPYELPKGWVWCRLGSIVLTMNNGIYKEDKYYNDDGIACLRMYNIQNGEISFHNLKRMSLTISEIETYSLKPGDLLLNRVNSIELLGKSAYIDKLNEVFVYESKNIRVRLFEAKILPRYINYLFQSSIIKDQIFKKFKKMTGQASINQGQITSLLIPLPPLPEQQRIVAKIEQLMAYCNELEQSITQSQKQAEQLLQAVLKEAFSEGMPSHEQKGTAYKEPKEHLTIAAEPKGKYAAPR